MISELAGAALDVALVLSGGGRLVVAAPGRHDHAQHVAVEFLHPAVVGARSWPAVAVEWSDVDGALSPDDALVIITPSATFDPGRPAAAAVITTDPSASEPDLVRWYHVLWELVQVGLEHPGITGGQAVAGGDSTNFLYPFLDASESHEAELRESMRSSALAKQQESELVSSRALAANDTELDRVTDSLVACWRRQGIVYAIGNGGSACDAARIARLLRAQGLRAASLAADPAIVTALANDLGVEQIFARQVEAVVRPGDVLVALSTSGASANLLAALEVDVLDQVTTVTSAGYHGGPLAEHRNPSHCLSVDSTSVHRIQEAQGVLIDELCARLRFRQGAAV